MAISMLNVKKAIIHISDPQKRTLTSDRMPPPHPASITLRPSSGFDENGSLLEEQIDRVS
jgi:hypothetical protein